MEGSWARAVRESGEGPAQHIGRIGTGTWRYAAANRRGEVGVTSSWAGGLHSEEDEAQLHRWSGVNEPIFPEHAQTSAPKLAESDKPDEPEQIGGTGGAGKPVYPLMDHSHDKQESVEVKGPFRGKGDYKTPVKFTGSVPKFGSIKPTSNDASVPWRSRSHRQWGGHPVQFRGQAGKAQGLKPAHLIGEQGNFHIVYQGTAYPMAETWKPLWAPTEEGKGGKPTHKHQPIKDGKGQVKWRNEWGKGWDL